MNEKGLALNGTITDSSGENVSFQEGCNNWQYTVLRPNLVISVHSDFVGSCVAPKIQSFAPINPQIWHTTPKLQTTTKLYMFHRTGLHKEG